ncbi:hypothetical protein [Actinoplanes cyaneus]|uniref:hypothetical protein n=1 Tax=Actinoplanes cyaneus TaxID=52696 RepID=UPI001943A15E|nr:hypothetical protein [Actinoplanes cyaneus]
MSDDYIRLIPTDPAWQPKPHDAAAAVAYVTGLFAGPGDDVWAVEAQFYDRPTVVDAGMYLERITCPRCGADIALDWLGDLVRANSTGFDRLDARVPCCNAVGSLTDVRFEDPIGFARFVVSAMNATRAKYELDTEELTQVAGLLGHPVMQIIARY